MRPAGQRIHYMSAWNDSNETGTPDSAGQVQPSSQKVCDFYGAIDTPTAGSKERWGGYHVKADAAFLITMPYVSGLTSRSWFTLGSRRFNAAGPPINVEQRNRELIIPVNEAGSV